jgi:3-phenylpropionate/trans-cinnamate dioxygenase ferredoxin reductase subunit
MSAPIVIVGAGQAGVQTAEALRSGGFDDPIVMLGDEPHAPYHRPPLSKAWLAGEMSGEQLTMRSLEVLAKKRIELQTGTLVAAIDRAARQVRLADGTTIGYRGLVLATGSTPRALPVPGGDGPRVAALRGRDDGERIAQALRDCAVAGLPVVVVGGGFIGLEVAATARKQGLAVTILEALPRLMARAVAPVVSDWYAALHRQHGVDVVLGAQVSRIDTDADGGCTVRTADGRAFRAGLVVVGIGVVPNDRLASEAGLRCDRGVVVDACARTSDPAIVAAGDCTARALADGTLLRLESVQNAVEQGRSAAAALLGQERPFVATPWFWSDQYDVKLQMAGLSGGADQQVVRGDPQAGKWSVYHFRDGRLIAVDSINASADHLIARRLLDKGVFPTAAQVADPAFDLGALAKG